MLASLYIKIRNKNNDLPPQIMYPTIISIFLAFSYADISHEENLLGYLNDYLLHNKSTRKISPI